MLFQRWELLAGMSFYLDVDKSKGPCRLALLIPCHNSDDFLEDLLHNLDTLGTTTEFDILFMDDGSATPLSAIMHTDTFSYRIYRTDNNVGLVEALNTGLSIARELGYSYVARQDSDDRSLPGRFERQIEALESENTAICATGFYVIDENGQRISIRRAPADQKSLSRAMKFRNPFAHSSFMFNLKQLEKIGAYDKNFYYAEDYELLFRAHSQNMLSTLPDCLVEYMINTKGISSARANQAKMDLKVARKYSDGSLEAMLGILKKSLLLYIPRRYLTAIQTMFFKGKAK